MIEYEQILFKRGVKYIAGIDEVGRGPLAGPMVVGAVILDVEGILRNYDVSDITNLYTKINDSKKVSEKNRNILSKFILNNALSYSIYEVSALELDQKGISQITQEAFYGVIQNLKIKPEHVLTDTFKINKITEEDQTNIISGDGKSISIAAASIIAKVYRDNIMINYHDKYPLYGFDKHKGYGTKFHIESIRKHGICDIHRKSFEPIKTMLNIH